MTIAVDPTLPIFFGSTKIGSRKVVVIKKVHKNSLIKIYLSFAYS